MAGLRGALILAVALIAIARGEGPQPPLPERVLLVGPVTVRAEVADTDESRRLGLMRRDKLEDGRGMLFVFASPRPMSFWMKDTTIPLSIAYINAAGVIREIHDMQPLDETPAQSAFPDLLYALEVPQGWFLRNRILPGDRVAGLPAPPVTSHENRPGVKSELP